MKKKKIPADISAAAAALASLRMVKMTAEERSRVARLGGLALKAKREAESLSKNKSA